MTLSIVWSYAKKYWQLIVAVLLFAAGYYFYSNRVSDLADALEKIRKRHEDELREIQAAYDKELAAKADALKKMQDTLAIIEQKYQEAQRQLDDKKRKEIAKIIEETQDDPQELARRLQQSTGFKIEVGS